MTAPDPRVWLVCRAGAFLRPDCRSFTRWLSFAGLFEAGEAERLARPHDATVQHVSGFAEPICFELADLERRRLGLKYMLRLAGSGNG